MEISLVEIDFLVIWAFMCYKLGAKKKLNCIPVETETYATIIWSIYAWRESIENHFRLNCFLMLDDISMIGYWICKL